MIGTTLQEHGRISTDMHVFVPGKNVQDQKLDIQNACIRGTLRRKYILIGRPKCLQKNPFAQILHLSGEALQFPGAQ